MSVEIVALASHHRREDFDCGGEALNEFLHRYARQQLEVVAPRGVPGALACAQRAGWYRSAAPEAC